MIWLVTFNPRYGPLNLLLARWGCPPLPGQSIPAPRSGRWWRWRSGSWGESFVVLLASLRSIPPISTLLLTARDLIVGLQASFTPSLLVTKGGPGYATLFLPLYTYTLAFDDLRLGYAATVVWAMYVLTLAVVALQFVVTRRWRYAETVE